MIDMRRLSCACILALMGATVLGCGSQTKTVTVASTPPAPTTTSAPVPMPTTSTSKQPTMSTTSTPSTTRTAPEPSFTEGDSKPGSVSAAAAVLAARGYTAQDTSEYHPEQTLQVLVGTRTGSGDGYGQQAFFFLDGHYLGTDTKEPSAKLKVVSQSDTEVAISYPLYRSGDPLCCARGGQRVVHFQLNDGKLAAMDPIPPAHSTTGVSRN
jgi:LppP/LprE lipoprotein